MDAAQIHDLANNLPTSPSARLEIYEAAKELLHRAEPARETCFRLFTSNGVAAAGISAIDLGLFRILGKNPQQSHTCQELSSATGADAILILRLLRTLAAWGFVAHVGLDTFQATNNTVALTSAFAEECGQMQTQFHGPMLLAVPAYLKEIGYKNPSDTSHTPFHVSYNTDMEVMAWLAANPEWFAKVMAFFPVQRDLQLPWMSRAKFLEGFDLEMAEDEVRSGRALFVDVGGAVGHQSIAFRESNPQLKGAVILQDLPFAADMASKDPRFAELDIKAQAHDFLTPQTLEARGAKIFYLRNVLHDWADEKNLVILKHIADVMAEDSLLIIDEAVVPDKDVAVPVAAYDMVMLAFVCAQERSEGLWRDLLERQAGLKIRDIRVYDEGTSDSLIFVSKS
ncbi:S-adenosyl-L-methionine-dependent methyltransferase [Periconia macrospinosa]|uniref:S-adenosyl-L-methionine-dependent methyltransferase n=1 Tax=Periconia macrospinosa TaxID=97972 RepID=A0A2V1DT85_9PLEO|nr:S-adenosyl-L-methionine-dependent methyltransferase [Periconia macrospinosa]